MSLDIRYCTLSDQAITPTRTHQSDAGYDLYSSQDCVLIPHQQVCIPTDIAIQFPTGYFGWVAPRSGLASQYAIHVLGGIIDQGYTGNITVILINLGQTQYHIHTGDRIAQLIIIPYLQSTLQAHDTLDQSTRGGLGLGSSGI